jgi:hypothetical protein
MRRHKSPNTVPELRWEAIADALADELLAARVRWHLAAERAAAAYGRWAAAPGGARREPFAAYVAALAREEDAAGRYEDLVAALRRGVATR